MGAQDERTIKLRYPGRCVVCGRELGRGEQGVWDGASRTVRCVRCPAGATSADAAETSVDPGVAGASAKRKYERIGGRNGTKLVQGVRRQGGYVRDALAGGEFANVDVRCALCFPKPEGLPLLRRLEIDGVAIDGPRRVAALARREGTAQAEEVEQLWRELARAFPAARR